ncbi:hypothetical protein C482_12659 [Natrialba chahannaoensis JCM 10990]|uniref:Uncharacterized protein n=1 Tax=Natrialba chahannaoensis JCM 10990 TaxID=1227492 RepID=M0AFE8_9EURY|nr:hypothetical protein [Natrialba chahannaoensis]ELY97475.1 hypothetical protein C482_12659 [Natrialba chahannaoensis JCM 10990]
MFDSAQALRIGRNLVLYAGGVGLLVVGALGLAAAIDLTASIAAVLFVVGLVLVLIVHEYFGGPV